MSTHPRGASTPRAAVMALFLAALTACGGGDSGGDDVGGTGSGPSALLFNEAELNEVRLTMSAADWQSILEDTRGDEWRVCTFQWKDRVLTDVGVRPAGESSRSFKPAKMSMRLKFDAFREQKFLGQEELKLDGFFSDPSMIRDRLTYWIFRTRMPAPRAVHCRLVVNGQFRGLYGIEEVWDDESVRERFANPVGFLYRIRGEFLPADPYEYQGNNIGAYVPVPWDPVTRQTETGRQHIIQFAQVMTNNPNAIDTICDVDNLVTYFAMNCLVMNTDGFTGDFEIDDHFQYFKPEIGRFIILPWDHDNTMGSNDDDPERSIFYNFENSVLTSGLEDRPSLRAAYLDRITEIMQQMPLSLIGQRIDFIYDQVRATAHEDTLKTWPSQTFDFNQQYIKDFAAARYASCAQQVQQGGGN